MPVGDINDYKVGDVLQLDGPSVPRKLRGRAYWIVTVVHANRVELSKPYKDLTCKIPWYGPMDRSYK